MEVITTNIPDILLFEPKVFGDERGLFFESFNSKAFADAVGKCVEFVQDNHSSSRKGVLRGLHYQLAPYAQGKLVRVVRGAVFDVAVDIRPGSAHFGKWAGAELSEQNKRQLWIPPGFAHGFLTLTDLADLLYKATDYYAPHAERCIAWNDPAIGIQWPMDAEPLVSAKDALGVALADAVV
jgi:dTDP-4-dehydrorhamnose 3,5-epimerase